MRDVLELAGVVLHDAMSDLRQLVWRWWSRAVRVWGCRFGFAHRQMLVIGDQRIYLECARCQQRTEGWDISFDMGRAGDR